MRKLVLILVGLAFVASFTVGQTVVPKVPAYTVAPDLSNVANLKRFGKFTEEQKALLAKNAFFVSPSKTIQLQYIYEDNEYLKIPSFVTTDCVLHLYHLLYDFTLRRLEEEELLPILESLTRAMAEKSQRIYEQVSDPKVKRAALKNCAYFGVGGKLLDLKVSLPSEAKTLTNEEIEKIEAHASRERMSIFPYSLDYTQFNPRGHYTRSEGLKRFFKAMMWYGLTPLSFEEQEPVLDSLLLQSLLVTYSLRTSRVGEETSWDAWQRIYEPTVFFVGESNTLTPMALDTIIAQVYPKDVKATDFADPAKFAKFKERVKALTEPKVQVALIGIPGGKQFRFMGQRYIPDTEMMQRLVEWPQRPFPKGLDVFAVLGSPRAKDLLLNFYQEQNKWPSYPDTLDVLRKQFSAVPEETWHSNLYWGWMDCWRPLLEPKGEGYPNFMTCPAWADKTLNTVLASWAELRHDTILYATQSGAEGGEGDIPPQVRGYVEPDVEFYSRVIHLIEQTREGLKKHKLIREGSSGPWVSMERLLKLTRFLKSVSEKELQSKPLTRDEYESIKYFGAEMDYLILQAAGVEPPDYLTGPDADMAVIADVHTSQGACLEEGVGHANELYVVVPIQGKLYLTRGATFSYYEFTHPSSDRLTDESWQKMLNQGKATGIPEWTNSFLTGPKSKLPLPKVKM